MPQPRNTHPAPAEARGDAPIARRYKQVGLPDGTGCEVAREGGWVYVRLPDGKEGRLRSRRFDSLMQEGRAGRAGAGRGGGGNTGGSGEARSALAEAMRRSTWSLVGFVVLVLVVLMALLLVSVLGGP